MIKKEIKWWLDWFKKEPDFWLICLAMMIFEIIVVVCRYCIDGARIF